MNRLPHFSTVEVSRTMRNRFGDFLNGSSLMCLTCTIQMSIAGNETILLSRRPDSNAESIVFDI
jgi:hypothetical protein